MRAMCVCVYGRARVASCGEALGKYPTLAIMRHGGCSALWVMRIASRRVAEIFLLATLD